MSDPASGVCAHAPTWAASSSSPTIREWQQGTCATCGAYASYYDGGWHFGEPPPLVLQLAAERDQLRAVVAHVAGLVVQDEDGYSKVHLSVIEDARAVLAPRRKGSREAAALARGVDSGVA